MATWKSNKSIKWWQDMGMSHSDNENSWEYGTVSDYLTVTTKIGEFSDFSHHPASEKQETYSKNEALALLETLLDWANKYEGSHKVDEIMKRVKND
jgi:hypothetical protein